MPAPKPYKFQEFPRVVYGPDDESLEIQSEDERPDGWVNSPGEVPTSSKRAADAATKKAERAAAKLRAGYISLLEEHKVQFDKDLDTEKLEELVKALEAHLAKQEAEAKAAADAKAKTAEKATNSDGKGV